MTSTREVAAQFASSMEAGDIGAAFGMLAEDGIYTVIGTTRASGKYHGAKELFERLVPMLSGFVEPPSIRFEPPIVDGDRAVLVGAGKGIGPTGPYNQPHYVWVMHVENGKISEITEHMDTCVVETGIFGKKIVDA